MRPNSLGARLRKREESRWIPPPADAAARLLLIDRCNMACAIPGRDLLAACREAVDAPPDKQHVLNTDWPPPGEATPAARGDARVKFTAPAVSAAAPPARNRRRVCAARAAFSPSRPPCSARCSSTRLGPRCRLSASPSRPRLRLLAARGLQEREDAARRLRARGVAAQRGPPGRSGGHGAVARARRTPRRPGQVRRRLVRLTVEVRARGRASPLRPDRPAGAGRQPSYRARRPTLHQLLGRGSASRRSARRAAAAHRPSTSARAICLPSSHLYQRD